MSLETLSDKFSLILTNVVACKSEFEWNGKKSLYCFFYAPGFERLYPTVSILTVGKSTSMSLISDEAYIDDPK